MLPKHRSCAGGVLQLCSAVIFSVMNGVYLQQVPPLVQGSGWHMALSWPPHKPPVFTCSIVQSCLVQSSLVQSYLVLYITRFKFMANKQFRMERKKLGTSVCTDISHYALKNQYIQFLQEKNHSTRKKVLVFLRFLDQIRLTKTGFWTNIEINVFFSIQYLNILQFIKTVVDNMCVLFYKKSRQGCKKIINSLPTKFFWVFKGAIFGIFEPPKTFFWKNVLLLFCHIHQKCLFNHVINNSFYKYKYWIEKKTFFSM